MSIEQLLFFLLLVAIPLLERLIRALRARTAGLPGERTPAPAEATVLRPRSPVSVPDAGGAASEGRGTELLSASPLPLALPQAVAHATPEQLHASEREPGVRRERKHGPPTSLRAGHSDRPIALRRVIAGADLRRAIVLIAILAPCRALEPKDASQLAQ
ncbi:MAG: hypothetical protein LC791_06980 [Acidobacteria bacterium]|nr:hypothetical protein [Acidobacteriota bacterium]